MGEFLGSAPSQAGARAVRLLALALALGALPQLRAQQPFPGGPAQWTQTQPIARTPPEPANGILNPSTFSVSTSLVVVPTLVEKPDGEIVYGLRPSDFALYDDGVQQKIHVDDDLDIEPVSLVICVERGRDAPLEFSIIRHLGPLLDLFAGGNRGDAALVAFDSRPVWVDPFTGNTDLIAHDLASLQAGDGGAAIVDAVGYSVNLLEQQPANRRRILLLISESRDHGSHHFNIPRLVERIGTSNTLVLSLVFAPSKSELLAWARGNPVGPDGAGGDANLLAPLLMTVNAMRRNTPRTLAALSGGEYAPFTREKAFEKRVAEEANHARNRYILSFHPTDLTPGPHTIQVKLTLDYGARVIARNSYWMIRRGDAGDPDAPGQP
jgi:VWFA-related protein